MAKIQKLTNQERLATRLKNDFKSGGKDFVLLFAHNGTGKTRLSMEFKELGKRQQARDTLYFNAYTEDLFSWDNDLENDNEKVLRLNQNSSFFNAVKQVAVEDKIREYLSRYARFDFKIDYEKWEVSFSQGAHENIKISRGEETIFIWSFFLAIVELVKDDDESYNWVEYIYIDDPISSLDENNIITLACDLAKLLKSFKKEIKSVISTHHTLFFNLMYNELKGKKISSYFLYFDQKEYHLQSTTDTPFFHHIANTYELKKVADSNNIYTYHFNILRVLLEKTANFLGYSNFSECIIGLDDAKYARALNLLSHGAYSIYEPHEMGEDNKNLFKTILEHFLQKHHFNIPQLEFKKENQ